MASRHPLHEGELKLQKRKGTPAELAAGIPDYITRDMPQQHADFFADLPYLPLATLDGAGRPWASLLVTKSSADPSVGLEITGHNQTDLVAETNPFDPFAHALAQAEAVSSDATRLFAGVGVDFTNRRRNKLAGTVASADIETPGKIHLRLASDQHLGNCPKYITVRDLEHMPRRAALAFDGFEEVTTALPDAAKAVIDQASTTFLATKHSAQTGGAPSDQRDMGLNHRGGAPGFVRLYETQDGAHVTTYLVLPDHSGNRFYQSLGNIETDRQVGLVFPDFNTGDVLYVTGDAENLHEAEAKALMPRVDLLTRIKVTGAVLVTSGLNLRLTSEESYSPYNPPVKYLQHELEAIGHSVTEADAADPVGATLVSTQTLSSSITTFNFKLTSPVEVGLPGAFGVFDFSELLDSGYRHMSEANPQLVNEDYVRTWTLSNAAKFDAETGQFGPSDRVSITVKRKPNGLMSNFLHDYADQLQDRKLPIGFRGTGAGFSCFAPDAQGHSPRMPEKMLWIAGGVGITPFMTMWDGITQVAKAAPNHLKSDIVLLFSGRGDDIEVLLQFLDHSTGLPEGLKLTVQAFQSQGETPANRDAMQDAYPKADLTLARRRIQSADLEAVAALTDREIYMCGPDALMRWSENTLSALGVDTSRIHQENFSF